MRRIDRRLGVPACALLTAVAPLRRRRRLPGAPRSLAVVKLAEQGATVTAHGALARAAQAVGPEQLYVVVFAENRPILDELGVVPPRNVLAVRTGSLGVLAGDVLRAVGKLRRARVDAVVDFESFSRLSAIVCSLVASPVRVGLHSYFGEGRYRGDLFTHRVAANPQLHAADAFDALVQAAFLPPEELPTIDPRPVPVEVALPRTSPTPAERERLEGMLGGPRSGPIVVANANASDLLPLRRWPVERYEQLAVRVLEARPDASIVLTGGPSEAEAAGALAAAIGPDRCVDLAGRTSLRELLVLLSMADVLVTNDSGPAHFAQLTGVETVTLFGPETPAVFGPRSDRATNLWLGLPCSPCVNAFNDRQSACTHNACMTSISVEMVLDHVLAAIERSERRRVG